MGQQQDTIKHSFNVGDVRDTLNASTIEISGERLLSNGHQFVLEDETILNIYRSCLVIQRPGQHACAVRSLLNQLRGATQASAFPQPRITFIGTEQNLGLILRLQDLCNHAGFKAETIEVTDHTTLEQIRRLRLPNSLSKNVVVMANATDILDTVNRWVSCAMVVTLANGRSWQGDEWGDIANIALGENESSRGRSTPWTTIEAQQQEGEASIKATDFAAFLHQNNIDVGSFIFEASRREGSMNNKPQNTSSTA